MIGQHREVGAPLLFEADKHAHPDGMDTRLAHPVEAVHAPLKVSFHSTRMVDVVIGLVVSFLETDHTVQSVLGQRLVLLGLERHHFNFEVAEIRLGEVKGLGDVVHAGLGRVLARHQQQVLKRSQLLDGLVFVLHLLKREDGALHRVADVEAAIDAGVGAGVGEVERYEQGDGFAKTLLGIFLAQAGHRLQEGRSRRGNEGHKVIHVAMLLAQRTHHIVLRLGEDGLRGLFPRYLF